ncbi:MAG: hypothetical protein FJX77_07015, partial [Armatimonadetes bacterium]|nr:hypothetical protein [Armatimonadota bacterium]
MPIHYALDFGTTNTVLASDREGAVTVVAFPDWMAERIHTPVVPSAVCFREQSERPFIGQQAVLQNAFGRLPGYAQGFKCRLGHESHRRVARWREQDVSARRAAEAFFEELRDGILQSHTARAVGSGRWLFPWRRRWPVL